MTQFAPTELPDKAEIQAMAGVLARWHGSHATEVARLFAGEHDYIGDKARASVWDQVCVQLERMTAPRTLS